MKLDLSQITQSFLEQLQDANTGKPTTLPYIIHELPQTTVVQEGETFQVMVFGGSIFLSALLKKQGDRLIILTRESKGSQTYPTEKAFVDLFLQELHPDVQTVAINFAFPLQPVFENNKLDGVLLNGTKEHTFTGLNGKKVGELLEQEALKTKNQKITVSLANDTICLLLSGLTQVSARNIAAGIVGTGMNFAFFLDDNKVVNLEAANFHGFPRTEQEIALDKTSTLPGKVLLEKAVSGAYLYRYYTLSSLSSTQELDVIAKDKNHPGNEMARKLFERSANLIACLISAIVLSKKSDMTFVMEGSVFWNGYKYRQTVKKIVLELVPDYGVTFVKIEDSPILGAAKLVA